jgi:predicted phosphodiesterase
MRIQVLSDLHIEFGPFQCPSVGADVIVLAGDIGTGTEGVEEAISLSESIQTPIVYVPGNHEFYHDELDSLRHRMRTLSRGTQVFVLDDSEVTIKGVRFLGATLWTDFCVMGPERQNEAMTAAASLINDFRLIRKGEEVFSPAQSYTLHERSRQWIERKLNAPFAGKTVVVTHHAPSLHSHPQNYAVDYMTSCFISNMDHMMSDERVAMWVHGHTHYCVDYTINGTRIVSNQRGYVGYDMCEGFDAAKLFEV